MLTYLEKRVKFRILFSDIEELVLTHLLKDNRRYICNICGKSMRDKTDGRRHLESIHFPQVGAYTCAQCGKLFNSVAALRSHGRLDGTLCPARQ